MPASLSQLTAFGVFLAIAAVGFLFLLVALAFGEVFGHLGHLDFGHDLDHGGGPGFFSVRIMSVFVTAFGGFGAVAAQSGLSAAASSAVGFASGLVFASLIWGFATFLHRQQASSEVRVAELVGANGRVVVAIPRGGVGQVRCQIGEQLIDKIARARNEEVIPENTMVRIEEVVGETVVVRRG